MQRVLVNMQNYVLGEAVEQVLKNSGEFYVTVVETPDEVVKKQFYIAATVVLLEVTGYAPYSLSERMKIRDEIRKQEPNCKIVFMVDENAESKLAGEIRQIKLDGLIDQFVYGSVSASYLAALLETL